MEHGFKRFFLVNSGIIVGSFVLAAALFYVLNNRLAVEGAAIAENRERIDRSTRAAERLAALKVDLPAAEAYERAMTLLLPSQEGLLDLPRDVETIGRLHGIAALFTFSGESDATVTERSYLSFTITGTGQATNLLAFLKAIEVDHPKFTLSIDSFDLTGTDLAAQQLLAVGKVYFTR